MNLTESLRMALTSLRTNLDLLAQADASTHLSSEPKTQSPRGFHRP